MKPQTVPKSVSFTACYDSAAVPDVGARVRVVFLSGVVSSIARARDGQVGVPGRDDRVEDIDASAVPPKVEELRVCGQDPQGVTVPTGLAAVKLKTGLHGEAFIRYCAS